MLRHLRTTLRRASHDFAQIPQIHARRRPISSSFDGKTGAK